MSTLEKGCSGGLEREKSPIAQAGGAPTPANEVRNGGVDAGLRSLDHYKQALPKWRYRLRQSILPIVRWETPYLACLQTRLRVPLLDSYFAITANLGTHTFFMIGLPMLYWCGYADFGTALVHILASGVFWTGFIKDGCSLPRPPSPPLQRITMSGSAALEYGFPSTHSANAVSVAVYSILCLRRAGKSFSPTASLLLELLAYLYALSVVVGRLYCGMHGFLDVIVGSIIGALISLIEFYCGPALATWIRDGSILNPLAVMLVMVVLVRLHPEPADDCPCFDDSVAFAGAVMGIELGVWRFAQSPLRPLYYGPPPGPVFELAALGWPVASIRIVAGVLVIFAWREAAKPTLLRGLPHLFHAMEKMGWDLRRRFLVPASAYQCVSLHMRSDNAMPSVGDSPNLVKQRSVSVAPQRYEPLAYCERRRESVASEDVGGRLGVWSRLSGVREQAEEPGVAVDGLVAATGVQPGSEPTVASTVAVSPSPPASPASAADKMVAAVQADTFPKMKAKRGEKDKFHGLGKPRVRYDVEVVTKLVVYTGIAWLAADLILVMFEMVGLGAGLMLDAL